MNYKILFLIPLAAVCVGTRANIPRLQTEIPTFTDLPCRHEEARQAYLFAFAYKIEKPSLTKAFCETAERNIATCETRSEILRERISVLCEL
ncbi:MAG: hypothetical protein AB7K68_07355 [Bacteriovoracia bacterium]